MATDRDPTSYERWMAKEGIPVHAAHGIPDVGAVATSPWERLGGRGAFLQLDGMEGLTGMFLVEIPPGATLQPEKHLYDELLYVLEGRGAMEVWTGPRDGSAANSFEWQAGSLFAPPANAWHRLHNTSGTEPARILGVTSAPLLMDVFHNEEFIFDCDYSFDDRFDGRPDYFAVGNRVETSHGVVWHTNFIPDARGATLDAQDRKGAGVAITIYQMASSVLCGHLAEWPVDRYHKAHYHLGGAVLLIVRSQGYTLMWPPEAGIRPFESGNADRVIRVDWREGSVLSPPTRWFHQHFNTGPEPARQLAFRYSTAGYVVGFCRAHAGGRVYQSVREGGSLIEYEDEDPEIARQFERALKALGRTPAMPDPTAVEA